MGRPYKDLLKNAKTIPVLGDLLKKKVTDLGFELGVVSTDPAFTMEHADLEGAEGLTNSKTKTIYLFGRAYTGTFGKNLNDTPADIARKNKIYLGAVVFHETFHLAIDGGHLPILKQLGIEFSPTGDKKKDEDAAAEALDLFIKNGCKSDSAKKEYEPKGHHVAA